MNDLGNLDVMDVEWNAWQVVVKEFAARDIFVNDTENDRLIAAIQAWGELLTELRMTQPSNVVKEARMQAVLKLLRVSEQPGRGEVAPR